MKNIYLYVDPTMHFAEDGVGLFLRKKMYELDKEGWGS